MFDRCDTPAPPVYGWRYEHKEPTPWEIEDEKRRSPLRDKAMQEAFALIRNLQQELKDMRKDIERLRLGPPIVLYSCPCQPPFRDVRPPYEVTS